MKLAKNGEFNMNKQEAAEFSLWLDNNPSSELVKLFAGKRILLVDDDIRNIFALSSVLEDYSIKVVFVFSICLLICSVCSIWTSNNLLESLSSFC